MAEGVQLDWHESRHRQAADKVAPTWRRHVARRGKRVSRRGHTAIGRHHRSVTRLSPKLAAQAIGVEPQTLHKWAREGRITRHPDGFELEELMAAEASRNGDALLSRAGVKFTDRPDTQRAS
jgi:hypothetical protein